MSEKIERFLKSIGIENLEDYDLEFDLCAWNSIDRKLFDMVIVKDRPWSYPLLKRFQEGLNTITTYRYSLSFSYKQSPTVDDAIKLFYEWFYDIYHIESDIHIEASNKPNTIRFVFQTEDDKNKYKNELKDFKDFLNFLYYSFYVETQVNEKAEKRVKQEHIVNEVVQEINIEHAKEVEETEDNLIAIMKENSKIAARERELAKRNHRGNYLPVDCLDVVDANTGNIDIDLYVFDLEYSAFNKARPRIVFYLNDNNGSAITSTFYMSGVEEAGVRKDYIGKKVRLRGYPYIDDYTKNLVIKGHFIDLIEQDVIEREECELPRVELHCHTKMSSMDAVNNMSDYCNYASKLGMKAIAITDHGVVQGYPEAQEAAKKTGMKMLYGCELYMVNDIPDYIKNPSKTPLKDAKYVVLDLETSGLSCRKDKIIEFGAVRIENGTETGRIDILINPEIKISSFTTNLTKITNDMVRNCPTIEEVFPRILDFIGDAIIIAHNAEFDIPFLNEKSIELGYGPLANPSIDTLWISRWLFPQNKSHRLGALCKRLEVNYSKSDAHRADYDAGVTAECWNIILNMLTKDGKITNHEDLGSLSVSKEMLTHMFPYHVVALAKDMEGVKQLFKLVSYSHVDYFANVPKIPKSILNENRSHLILGSACFNGEVFEIAHTKSLQKLKETLPFYDYIEIQPIRNYSHVVNMHSVSDKEYLLEFIKDIVNCADELNIPICATGDVHYLSKKEKIFRDVYIMAAEGVGKVKHPLNGGSARSDLPPFENPDQEFLSTNEMLNEMSFLGKEKAFEIVCKNTNDIADQCEILVPVPNNHLYTPTMENSDTKLTELCYQTAKEWYGDPIPEEIKQRLDKELNGIISNGYSVIYWIAHILVQNAENDGHMIGSRGSVGSSFVATMAHVTEVNPLPPHYRCPKCKHLEWTKETYPNIKSGFDLPDKVCPICGEKLIHDGQDIPFETFLGFNADKTPDIDLNIPSDYQATTHLQTQKIFGVKNCFRAGTIETVAKKTAMSYAMDYFELQGFNINDVTRAKIAYIANGCIDVKRTTGQHPGGIVVIPNENEVYDFTPIQYPADEDGSDWKTTHFDFHSIHDTVLKLDLLGHVDPMALEMMSNLTGLKIRDIPLNDPKVLSIFSSPDALKLERNYLKEKTGALAIPEFGTNFVRGMLEQTQPKSVSDLIIISGLSHGTDVYLGNAEELIKKGVTDLRGVIGCRDDIMVYLIDKGLPSSMAFKIMEDVRKGKKVKPEYEIEMKAHNVPQYYIDSCNKIKYMFPKGHATAYVTMALRVGYFKVYYPMEFYTTFFSLRSKQYDIETMIKGEKAIIDKLEEFANKEKNKQKLSTKEEQIEKTLEVALEMYQRGFIFGNIDLYKSNSTKFIIDHEEHLILPPFNVIDGLGDAAAESVVIARKDGEFKSIEDLSSRTQLNKTNIEKLTDLGVISLPKTDHDQLNLFEFDF